jgi:hypothetical protein
VQIHELLPNYAIKATAVERLVSSFTSGASAPYFGCYAPEQERTSWVK